MPEPHSPDDRKIKRASQLEDERKTSVVRNAPIIDEEEMSEEFKNTIKEMKEAVSKPAVVELQALSSPP